MPVGIYKRKKNITSNLGIYAQKGVAHPKETKSRITKGKKRPPFSKEWIANIVKAQRKRAAEGYVPWNKNQKELNCMVCRKVFFVQPSRSEARFCSNKCVGVYNKGKLPWNKGKHGYLSSETRKKLSEAHHNISDETRQKMSRAKKGKPSLLKGKKLSKEHKEKLSRAKLINPVRHWLNKKRESMSGEKSHLWRGGITAESRRIRTSLEMTMWKRACLERDDFTCQKTGIRGGKLVVHHINNFADFPELRTSITNGITLSKESHQIFHKKYGIKNNTREQLEEYLGRTL